MTSLSGPVLTAAQMHDAELACKIALPELMERAGAALAEAVWRFGGGAATLVLCGPGNNGGDGYVVARLLAARGVSVQVVAHGEPTTDLSRAARALWTGPVMSLDEAMPALVLVDALFGTGLSRPLGEPCRAALARFSACAELVIAADLPSGIGADDGADLSAVDAGITIAFGAAKPAHLLQPAAARCGHVLIADIGIGASSDVNVLARPTCLQPTPNDHKYTRGMVVVVGGAMPGAGALATTAALRSGAGYVVAVGLPATGMPHAIVHRDMDVLDDSRIGAVLIGPGLGRGAEAEAALNRALASQHPLVLDGDALALVDIAELKRTAPTILTPHVGEFNRMFGGGTGSKIDRARDAATRSGCTVIFKGSDTVIASPDGRVTLAPMSSPWLSTAGTGDVLAGVTGAMLARGFGTHEAACAAVWIHAEAARRAGRGLIADDLLLHLAECL
jgi:ADP-dependent NAD(P)H-hydrate dehydratase / NAD(P)H-hydrate epimerase